VPFGLPKPAELKALFQDSFDELKTILIEIRDILKEIRDRPA
jgi:hypothetical protein